jgi:DNA polymerase I-like protein with 3'-5' exonuclease and polymerase domains
MFKFLSELPFVNRDPEVIDLLEGDVIGNDLEWNQYGQPTILGLSDGVRTVSVPFEDGVDQFRELLSRPEIRWVGHNIVAADLLVLEKLGLKMPLEQCEDTIIYMWLVNPNLAKSTQKAALEEDGGERRGRGFFNLSTLLSIYSDLPHYKDCRGENCTGACPKHAPFEYNGIDSLGPVLTLPKLQKQARLRKVDRLYPMHRELAYVLAQMQDYGVKIDEGYVDDLNAQFRHDKEEIERVLPFNPKSPKAVSSFFAEKHDIKLRDAQEETVREMVEELEDAAPEELVLLLDYKELGNGTDRWFEREYRDKNGWLRGYMDAYGFVHPRLNFFTSSGRLACSSPNFQNVAKRRVSRKVCVCGGAKQVHPTQACAKFKGESVGKKIRRAIIAPEGWYITRADLSNAENRVALHFGGYTIKRDVDLHEWVKEIAGITEDMEISLREGNAREAAKKIQHANNNLEGLQLKAIEDIRSKKIRAEIEAGARKVHWDWKFRGKIVTFSGSYEAKRTFGDASWENRKKVLEVNEKYTAAFPGVIDFRKRVSKSNEENNAVIVPLGYVFPSYGDDNDRMKIGQSVWQQNPVAHVTKLALLNCWKRWKRDGLQRPVLQVHDEILCYTHESVDPMTAKQWLQEDMEMELKEIPGLIIPAEASTGKNWGQQNK